MRLLDVNVLMALAWPNHAFHAASRAWFARSAATGWGTCQLVDAAFVRLSASPAVVAEPRRPAEALALLLAMKAHRTYHYLDDAALDAALLDACLGRCLGHQQVNDAFLVALAASHGARVATFDRRLAALATAPEQVEVMTA